MDTDLEKEDTFIKLRSKLNEERIKLWEPPYYVQNNGPSLKDIEKLAETWSVSLELPIATITEALVELQSHSLERLKANDEFKESGIATLRVRASATKEKTRVFNVQMKLSVAGHELSAAVAATLEIDETMVKLIHRGRIIKSQPTLEDQGVKNGTQLLALVLSDKPECIQEEDSMYAEMKKAREDALLLTEYVDEDGPSDDEHYMQLEDQAGNSVNVPAAERRSLLVGMALHEKGRTAIRAEQYHLALVLLLEADRHFNECNASILSGVDNPALLQLDIAWCYLALRSLAQAGDAAARLTRADTALARSYGRDMERVRAVKGNTANERTLLMRLHLLQGIVAYHQNRRAEAKRLLEKAEVELNSLKVDDSALASLMELGYTATEARLGLRAGHGDVAAAVHFINSTREERLERRRRAHNERIQRALGKCLNGELVSGQFVEMLQGMGYVKKMAVLALKNSNNNVSEAVRLIQEHPELFAELSTSESSDSSSSSTSSTVDTSLVEQLTNMGYNPRMARAALKQSRNVLEDAVEQLMANGGIVSEGFEEDSHTEEDEPGTSKKNNKAAENTEVEREKDGEVDQKKTLSKKRKAEQKAAFDRLAQSISTVDDDHLDGPLHQEEMFLQQYKSLLM